MRKAAIYNEILYLCIERGVHECVCVLVCMLKSCQWERKTVKRSCPTLLHCWLRTPVAMTWTTITITCLQHGSSCHISTALLSSCSASPEFSNLTGVQPAPPSLPSRLLQLKKHCNLLSLRKIKPQSHLLSEGYNSVTPY